MTLTERVQAEVASAEQALAEARRKLENIPAELAALPEELLEKLKEYL